MVKRSLVKLSNNKKERLEKILSISEYVKRQDYSDKKLEGKNIALLFEKPSTRTRSAFEIAVKDLGGNTVFLDKEEIHLGYRESLEDTAKVLESYFDGVGFRGMRHEKVERLDQHTSIPVWNLLTDKFHPTQVLSDFFTIEEVFEKDLSDIKLAYIGNGINNVLNSLIVGAAKTGMNMRIVTPEELRPDRKLMVKSRNIARKQNSTLKCFSNVEKGLEEVDVVYTDVWVSMNDPKSEWDEMIDKLSPYSVDNEKMDLTSENSVFMHCLPALHDKETILADKICERHGIECLEVSDNVFRSDSSIVFQQSENKLHTLKSLLIDSFD